MSPLLDVLITLLHWGAEGWQRVLQQREDVYRCVMPCTMPLMYHDLRTRASGKKHQERISETKQRCAQHAANSTSQAAVTIEHCCANIIQSSKLPGAWTCAASPAGMPSWV